MADAQQACESSEAGHITSNRKLRGLSKATCCRKSFPLRLRKLLPTTAQCFEQADHQHKDLGLAAGDAVIHAGEDAFGIQHSEKVGQPEIVKCPREFDGAAASLLGFDQPVVFLDLLPIPN